MHLYTVSISLVKYIRSWVYYNLWSLMLIISHLKRIILLFHTHFPIRRLRIGQYLTQQSRGYHMGDFLYKCYDFIVHIVGKEYLRKQHYNRPTGEVKTTN